MKYSRIWRAVAEHSWAILPSAMDVLVEVLARRVDGRRFSAEEIAQRLSAARQGDPATEQPGIARLQLFGLMAHRMNQVDDISGPGGTSTEVFGTAFRRALADPQISGIVLDVNSPGGSVHGVPELGQLVYESRGAKPIVAVANAMAASAAYWVASQADELVVTPSGEVGSVGVLAVHEDWSKADEQDGLKVTYVHAGRFKIEGNPDEPLGDEARTYLQARVDEYYDQFVRAVARGRGVAQKAVREEFGEGRMVGAERAVKLGMADRVETIEATIQRLSKRVNRSGSRAEADVDLDSRRRWQMQTALGAR